jgi:hypothetical protein
LMGAASAEPLGRGPLRPGNRPRSKLQRSRVRAAWLFLTPMLVMLALVAGWPLARTIWFSFTNANLNNLSDYDFIGFENYLANYDGEWLGLLTDPDWSYCRMLVTGGVRRQRLGLLG